MDKKEQFIRKHLIEGVHPKERDAFVKTVMNWIYDAKPTALLSNTQVSQDGKHWEQAKQEPYQLYGVELLKCSFGFHELVQSKKYAHTKYCFRCGKRKTSKKFAY